MNFLDALGDETVTMTEQVRAMQEAINSGVAWRLEGSYGRLAMSMIEEGYCVLGPTRQRDYYGSMIGSREDVVDGTKGSISYAEKVNPHGPWGWVNPDTGETDR